MSYQFTISDIGLRLIKAYEGYHPEGRTTRDGRKIVGYGRVTEDLALKVNPTDAESFLKADLAEIEHAVNNHVHAALSQSQFDALCSLAHSIGLKTFLDSDILHALNQGEVITAANGFDAWRLGQVNGKIYVVDALVRRRTAEKALFLRPPLRTVPAPHGTLKAYKDEQTSLEKLSPIGKGEHRPQASSSNIVRLYEKDELNESLDLVDETVDPDIIHLTEKVDDDDFVFKSDSQPVSPIAEAAAEVSERLDALMESKTDSVVQGPASWPDSLVTQESDIVDELDNGLIEVDPEDYRVETLDHVTQQETEQELFEDPEYSSADRYIQRPKTSESQGLWAYITMIIFGLTATSAGLWAYMKAPMLGLGEWSSLLAAASVAMGGVLLIMGLYYLMKHLFGKS